jgi:hypothetical protein
MGRFVLDQEEFGSGVARPPKPEAIWDGPSCVEFRRSRIDVAVSPAGERRASSILECHGSLLSGVSRRGVGTRDMLGAWQDKGPTADNLAFTMTNSQGLRGGTGRRNVGRTKCDAPGRQLRSCDMIATRPAFRLDDEPVGVNPCLSQGALYSRFRG